VAGVQVGRMPDGRLVINPTRWVMSERNIHGVIPRCQS
jgi:hypothetical protein